MPRGRNRELEARDLVGRLRGTPLATAGAMAPARDRVYPWLFGAAALGVLGWVLWKIFTPFVGPILWSTLLAFLLQPLQAKWKRRLGGRETLAASLLTVAATLCLILPAAALGAAFPGQVSQLVARVSEESSRLRIEQPSDLFRLPAVAAALDWLQSHFAVTADGVRDWAAQQARHALELLAARGGTVALGAFGALLDLVLVLFLLFFFLRDGKKILRHVDRIVPLSRARKAELAGQIGSVTQAVVFGILATAIVQGALVAIGFALAGLPSAIVFGVIAGAASLLPVGGTALVWGPGAFVLAAEGRWPRAIGLALYGVLVVSFLVSDVLKPRWISSRARISTLPVFFGVLGGLAAFGLIGAILGPVAVALALALLRWVEEEHAATAG